ncbi:MAG: translation initiation factor IF-3 [Patescibacteria group bacterium]
MNRFQKTGGGRIAINEAIRAKELRVIGSEAENYGVMSREEALSKAREIGLDLIEISPTAVPPVAKIMEYGKYLYQEKKKQREHKAKSHATETKAIQVKIGTSEHSLGIKAKQASEWLTEGHRVKFELYLSGRAKYMDKAFLGERMKRFLKLLTVDYKVADEPKTGPKGMHMIIEKK